MFNFPQKIPISFKITNVKYPLMEALMLKILVFFLISFSSCFAGEMGEDVTNLDCQKSIHQPRELMASVKTIELDESNSDDESIEEDSGTLSK